MADIVNTNQFRNGMHIEHRGSVWRIVEFQHVKPGKGGAFVRTKLKNLESGAVVEDTFRAGEKFPRVHTEVKSVQFLYDDGSDAHFMDQETYEQFQVSEELVSDVMGYVRENTPVLVTFHGPTAIGIELPSSVTLKVIEAENATRGNTATNVKKDAVVETGLRVKVPPHISVGDEIKISTVDGEFQGRQN